jgi:hypothetical protein
MTLQPGCRFALAPHFHLPVDWSRRLLVGSGIEEAESCFFPRGPWRPPLETELCLLVSDPAKAAPEEGGVFTRLFQLPGHLRSLWWKLLEQAADLGDSELRGFNDFVDQVGEFLVFKGQAFPERARCDVVVSRPGQRSVRWDAEANRLAGLSCSLAPRAPWPLVAETRPPRLWGGINLGDEETSFVLVNLPCSQLAAELRRRGLHEPSPKTVGELAERFLRCCADYPPVRLVLGAGEGCRLPEGGLLVDGYPEGKQEPDVLLLISYEGPSPS